MFFSAARLMFLLLFFMHKNTLNAFTQTKFHFEFQSLRKDRSPLQRVRHHCAGCIQMKTDMVNNNMDSAPRWRNVLFGAKRSIQQHYQSSKGRSVKALALTALLLRAFSLESSISPVTIWKFFLASVTATSCVFRRIEDCYSYGYGGSLLLIGLISISDFWRNLNPCLIESFSMFDALASSNDLFRVIIIAALLQAFAYTLYGVRMLFFIQARNRSTSFQSSPSYMSMKERESKTSPNRRLFVWLSTAILLGVFYALPLHIHHRAVASSIKVVEDVTTRALASTSTELISVADDGAAGVLFVSTSIKLWRSAVSCTASIIACLAVVVQFIADQQKLQHKERIHAANVKWKDVAATLAVASRVQPPSQPQVPLKTYTTQDPLPPQLQKDKKDKKDKKGQQYKRDQQDVQDQRVERLKTAQHEEQQKKEQKQQHEPQYQPQKVQQEQQQQPKMQLNLVEEQIFEDGNITLEQQNSRQVELSIKKDATADDNPEQQNSQQVELSIKLYNQNGSVKLAPHKQIMRALQQLAPSEPAVVPEQRRWSPHSMITPQENKQELRASQRSDRFGASSSSSSPFPTISSFSTAGLRSAVEAATETVAESASLPLLIQQQHKSDNSSDHKKHSNNSSSNSRSDSKDDYSGGREKGKQKRPLDARELPSAAVRLASAALTLPALVPVPAPASARKIDSSTTKGTAAPTGATGATGATAAPIAPTGATGAATGTAEASGNRRANPSRSSSLSISSNPDLPAVQASFLASKLDRDRSRAPSALAAQAIKTSPAQANLPFCTTGLYSIWRHPNYGAEFIFHAGMFVATLPALTTWYATLLALLGPLIFASVIRGATTMLEKRQQTRYGWPARTDLAYEEWVERTRRFL